MLLLPFIENAFKHGKTGKNNELHIDLSDRNDILYFRVKNASDPDKRKDEVSGIGIKNVKRRVALLYPDHNTIDINSTKNCFEIKLSLI